MTSIAALADVESIKRLKARYLRAIDAKDWVGLADLLTRDCKANFVDQYFAEGRDEVIDLLKASLTGTKTVHHGHMPDIQVDGASATGVWALADRVESETNPDLNFSGFGYYHDTYTKVDDEWRISSMRLTRVLLEPRAVPSV